MDGSQYRDARPAAVVFDLDGTLVLSEDRNAQVWSIFLGEYGIGVDAARLRQVTGRRSADSLAEVLAEFPDRFGDLSPADLAEQVGRVEQAVHRTPVGAVPGAVDLARSLAADAVPLGLVTSATRPYAAACLSELGLTGTFRVTVTAEDVGAGKPDPEGYLSACRQLGVAPGDAVGIEDSVAGVTAVVAAGMRCIGVATNQPRQALAAADLVVDDFTDTRALQALLGVR